MMIEFHDVMGCLGAIFVLLSYFLLQTKKITSDGLAYPLANFIGAFFILFSLANAWNLTAVLIEVVWAMISLLGIVKWYKAYIELDENDFLEDATHQHKSQLKK